MILLHLFHSMIARGLDTPRVRWVLRAACLTLLALVLAGAVTRGDEAPGTHETEAGPSSPPGAPETTGRGNVSIVHVESEPAAPVASHAEAEMAAGVEAEGELVAPAPVDTGTPEPIAGATAAVDSGHPGASSAEAVPHGIPAPVSEDAGDAAQPVDTSHAAATSFGDGRVNVIEDFAESGRRFWQAGDFAAAEKSFTRALTSTEPPGRKRGLVLEMAGLYQGAGQLSKAAAVLEKFIKTYPNDRDMPQVLLQLGIVYRDLGVHSMATARFFQVLNSTLRVNDEDIPEYRRLAMKARLEIAETYATQGNLAEAERYFARLQLLELEPADRERVMLRGAQMQFTLKQWLPAEKALAALVAASPESMHVPEARYMRAKALEELGRKQEAVEEVVALLRMPEPGDSEAARGCAYWKRRCANELANRFYEQGDFLGALAIYQALARASIEPSWRWPAIYQIGLCFERMNMPQRAAEAYDAILAPEAALADGAKLPESLASLQDMAKWRRSHLDWIEEKGRQLQSLSAERPAS